MNADRAPQLKASVRRLTLVRFILVLISIFSFAVPSVAQRHFYFDEPFTRTTKIPDAVVPLLRDVITNACRGQISTSGADVRSWFSASRIDLNWRRSAFIVKSGQHHCLTGADNAWFWIFLQTGRSYQLVLAGGTISIDVLKTRTRGLRDIETNAATAATNYTNVYKFDGRKRVICLDIPDEYEYMDQELVVLLEERVKRFIRDA